MGGVRRDGLPVRLVGLIVQALAAQNFLPPDRMVIGFAPVVINTGKELVLFDTGGGATEEQ